MAERRPWNRRWLRLRPRLRVWPRPLLRTWATVRPLLGTVRSQLTLLAAAVVASVLLVSAVGLVIAQRAWLTRGVDRALDQRADTLEEALADRTLSQRMLDQGDPEEAFVQVVDGAGRVVAASRNAADQPSAVDPATLDEQVVRTVPHLEWIGEEFRVLARPLGRGGGDRLTLVVGEDLEEVLESIFVLEMSLLVSVPVVTAALAALVWWLTGRVLRPVEAIRAEVAGIRGSQLDRRVPVPQTRDEIASLARTMNAMLDRVQEATDRERRFAADASHELRSPLTRMRSSLEVALPQYTAREEEPILRSLLADITDLARLVDDLLFLTRSDSGADVITSGPVDLDDLVLEEVRRLRSGDRVRVDPTAVSAARTTGDERQLARAIANLASNAERHATTTVRFELRELDGRCELVVADDGPGIPPEHHQTVFKRFTRLDEARSRDAGGSGLGLAIVHEIVSRHGGTIHIDSRPGSGARFVVTLPRAS